MYKNIKIKLKLLIPAMLLIAGSFSVYAEIKGNGLTNGMAARHDTSPPLRDLLKQTEQQKSTDTNKAPIAVYEIPNILEIDPSPAELEFNNRAAPIKPRGGIGTNGLASPAVDISVAGYSAADNISLYGSTSLPPDTNGDVGISYYIQYVNLGWKVFNKNDGTVAAGPFAGNSFWSGFGGVCETNNAGDPIVLYDKLADRWLFSQFTSSNNPDGRQCFAISTTNDPLGSYHRYEFVFPGVFNDYPHIGIWDDESGERSGYYFVTHDFSGSFVQASYAVVERTEMLTGNPAQFVRFTNTNFLGGNSYGAQPAHLESFDLPPAGMCNPFVLARPDFSGYQLVDLCVDWNDVSNSFLSDPLIVDAGESWSPGPGAVSQPNTGQGLDTLASFGRVMYRSSFRSYPDSKGLDDTMVFSFSVDLGDEHAGVRWAQINFPEYPNFTDVIFKDEFEGAEIAKSHSVANQGEYGPDTTDRWMPGISIDQDGNIGLAYSAANSSQNVFPGVRYTTRKHTDTENTLRNEQICVDGGGSQTGYSRWGDYSSVSIDPSDECTFWASVEYQPTTASANWSNRICSFKMEDCGDPTVYLDETVTQTMSVCSANQDMVSYDFGLNSFNGFAETVSLSVSNEPVTSSVSFPGGNTFSVFPATGTFEISNLLGESANEIDITLTATSLSVTDTMDYHLSISSAITNTAAVLTLPADNATGIDSYPTFTWQAVSGASQYRLEVATDAGFNNLVINAETDQLSYAHELALNTSTTYYWRVVGVNNCGDGVVSAVRQFNTGSFVTGTAAECIGGTSANVVFFDDLEGGTNGWSQPAAPVGTNTWTTSTARSFDGNAWFAQDLSVSSDQYLVSPPIVLPGLIQSPLSLSYWNFQELETDAGSGSSACWDGGLLEISTNGGLSYSQISSGQLIGDPYNGSITSNVDSPISGLSAWCASSAVPAGGDQADISIVNLDAYAGDTVQFRFRLGTDSAVGAEGWYIDNITVQGCQ